MVNTSVQQPKRMALYAAIGALIALLSYLLVPFITVTLTASANSSYGYSGSPSPYTQSVSLGAGLIALFASPICLEALFAVAVLCLAALFMLREAPFGQGIVPVTVQNRRGGYTIAVLGVIAVVYQFLLITIANGQINDALQSASFGSVTLARLLAQSNTTVSISIGYAIGSWIYLLGMLAVAVCGWLLARADQPMGAFMPVQQVSSANLQSPIQSSQPLWQQPIPPIQQSQPLWQQPEQAYPVQQQPVPIRQTQQFPPMAQPTPPYVQPQIHPWQQPSGSNPGNMYPPQDSF